MNNIKEKYLKCKKIYKEKRLGYWFSIAGSILMGSISLINTLIIFSTLNLYYSIFAYSLAFIKLIALLFKHFNLKNGILIYGSISLFIISLPLALSLIETILYKEKPEYIFFWIIYAYALYGTIKITNAIIGLIKAKKINNNYLKTNSYFSFIGALYTIQMMEFAMISTFGEGDNLFSLQILTLGAIFIICLILSILLLINFINRNKPYSN